jgi:hypothetical protein
MSFKGLFASFCGSFSIAVGIVNAIDAISTGRHTSGVEAALIVACFTVGLWSMHAAHFSQLGYQAEYLAKLLNAENTPEAEEPTP